MASFYKSNIFAAFWLLLTISITSATQYFSVEPQDGETLQGQRVEFSCRVINRPDGAQLYWQIPAIDDQFVGPEYQIPAALSGRYQLTGEPALDDYNFVINSATEEDAGVYRCILFQTGRGDSPTPTQIATSRDAQLSVATLAPNGAPGCWASPRRVVYVGDSVTLNCASTDGNLVLQWTRNSSIVQSTPVASATLATQISTTFNATASMNGERFTCLSTTINNFQCDIVLEVLSPPSATIAPVGEIKAGRDGRYRCTATGNPDVFSYSWRYNDEDVGFEYDRRFNMAYMEDSGAVLVLPDVQSDDEGATLECTAINENGEGRSELDVHVAIDNTTSIIAWCFCAVVVAIILILLIVFFYWRSQQHRKMEKLAQARKRNNSRRLDAEENGNLNPTFTSFSPLEVDSVGYGPDKQPYQSRPSNREYDHGGPKPIPRQTSTSGNKGGSDSSDADFISKDVENDDEEEMTQTYTYHVNPKFQDYRASYDVNNVVDDDNADDDIKKPVPENDLDLEKELVGELSMFSNYDHGFNEDEDPIVVSTEL